MSLRVVQIPHLGTHPLLIAGLLPFIACSPPLIGQTAASKVTASASRPSFDVASIKANPDCSRENEQFSPGRVSVTCIGLRDLIEAAYVTFADGTRASEVKLRILGGPDWINSSRFDITAKAEGNVRMEQMFGPMFQTLLEERFRIRVHHEIRQLPLYTMTVAKAGLRIHPTKEGSCVPVDLDHAPEASPNFCGRMTAHPNGGRVIDDAYGMTMPDIASRFLSNRLDRPVIDKTGIAGLFDAHLEFARENGAAAPDNVATDDTAPTFFTAVQEQLGLKLSADRGPVEVLIIDHVEQPSEN